MAETETIANTKREKNFFIIQNHLGLDNILQLRCKITTFRSHTQEYTRKK